MPIAAGPGGVVLDYDFHPDEPECRVFQVDLAGVLRLDDEVAVVEVLYPEAVLRHYAFADRWYKVNVTLDRQGTIIETGDTSRFAFNCDIATPMLRDGTAKYAVDLFIDVLVAADACTYVIGDEDEFDDMYQRLGLVSDREAEAARSGLAELVELIEAGRLFSWLDSIVPFGPCAPPPAHPTLTVPVPDRLLARRRPTW